LFNTDNLGVDNVGRRKKSGPGAITNTDNLGADNVVRRKFIGSLIVVQKKRISAGWTIYESGSLQVAKTPFIRTGKPEPLKYNLFGCWSHRIDQEYRIAYLVEEKNQDSFV